jgi:poly-beta-1,6-N-acetyl-D-glucosamine N-deacetylase
LIEKQNNTTPQALSRRGAGTAGRAGDANVSGGLMRAPFPFAALTAVGLLLSLCLGSVRAATILVYHRFGDHSIMSISLEAFEAQLDFLDQAGYKVISMEELTRALDARQNPPEKAVVLAIDDGWASFMKVFPLLAKRNLPFTLFLPMAFVANPYSKATLSQADLATLRAYPKASFANHSWLHSAKVAGNEALAREDIRKSVERFRQVFGHDTKYFAFPYGLVTPTYTRLLREAGFEYLFVTGANPPTATTDKAAIPRIAANRLSLTVLASVLRNHEAVLAKAKSRPAPAAGGPLLTETNAKANIPYLME